MAHRIGLALFCMFTLSGCYTQIRPPEYVTDDLVESGSPVDTTVVRIYKYHVYDHFDQGAWGTSPFFDPRWAEYPIRSRRGLNWRYSWWTAVYGPWWRGWMRQRLAHGRGYYPTVRYRWIETDPIELPEPHLRLRHSGLRGGDPLSAGTVRKGRGTKKTTRVRRAPSVGTTRANPKPEKSGSASGTASKPRDSGSSKPSSQKEEKKQEEKREEKREKQRRRGGMR